MFSASPNKPTFSFGATNNNNNNNNNNNGNLFKSLVGGAGGGGLFNFGGSGGGLFGGMFGGNAAQNNINNNNTRTGSILNPTSSLLPAATTALTTEVSADKIAKDRPTVLIVGTTPNAFYMYWVFQQCGFDVKAVAHVTSEGCRVPPPLTGNNKGNADNLTQFYKNTREAKKTSMDKSAMREAELFIKGCIDVYDLPKLKTAEEYQQERKEEANKLKELEEKLKNIQTNNNNNTNSTPTGVNQNLFGTTPNNNNNTIGTGFAVGSPANALVPTKEGEEEKKEEETAELPPPDPMRGVRAVALRTLLTDLSPVGTLKKKIEKEVAAKELEGSMTPVAAEAPRPSLFGGVSPSKRRMSAAERKQQQQQKQGQQSVADIVPDTFFDGIDVVYIAAPNMFNDRCKENDLTRGAHFDGNASLNNSSGGNRNKNQRFNRFSNKKPVRGSVEEFIRACMERGKHVLVEPPTAPNSFTISRLMETSTFKNNNKAKVVLMDRAASVWTDSSRLKFLKGLLGVNPLPSMTPQKPAGGGRGAGAGRGRGLRGRGRLSLTPSAIAPAPSAEQTRLKKLKVPSCKIGRLQRLQAQLCVPLSDLEKIQTATTVTPFAGGGVDLWFSAKYAQYIEQRRVVEAETKANDKDDEDDNNNKSTDHDDDSNNNSRRDSLNASVTSQLSINNSLSEMLVQNNPSGSPAPHVEKSRLLYGVLGDVGWYVMTHYLALFDWEMPASVRARVVARHPITKSPTVVEGELYFFVDFDQFDWEAHRQQQQAGTRGGKGGKKKGAQTPKKEANKGPRTSIGGGNFVRIIDHNSMDKKTIVAAHFYISNEADTALVQDFSASGSEGQVLVSDLLFPRVEGDEVTRGHGNTHNSNNPLDDDAPETTDEDSDLELSSPSSLSSSSPRVASPEPGSVPTSRSPRDTDLGANSTPNNASSSDAVDTLTVPTTTDNNNNNTSGSEVVVKPPEESLEDIIKKLPKVHSTYSLITVENTVTANGIPQRLRRQRVCAFPPEEYSDIRLGVKLRQLLQGQATAETTATGPVTGSVTPTRFGTSPSKFGRRNSQGNAPGGKKSDNNKNANAVKDQSHPSRFPITNPDEAMTYMSRMWRVQQLIETLYESAEREAYEREKHAKEMQVETSQNWGALEDKENFDNL